MGYSEKINKDKVLFLWLNDKEFHAVNARRRGIDTATVFKSIGTLLKIFRRLQITLNFPLIGIWLNSWKYKIDQYEVVIIHASKLAPPVVKYLRKKNPKLRIIVWYWNPVLKCVDLNKFPEDSEIWSFDEVDAAQYHLHYNTQYYFNDIKLKKSPIDYDVYFLGGDKGRLSTLLKIKKTFSQKGISTHFHITKTAKDINKNPVYKKPISYEKNLENIAESRAVMDIITWGQHGLSIRPLETMFLGKKLITNDKSIVGRDFYRKENVFILDHDNFNSIEDFLKTPMVEIPSEIKNHYDFDQWILRFFENGTK